MKIIGEEGNWTIYENDLDNKTVIKKPNFFLQDKVRENLRNYNLIKHTLNTVSFIKEIIYNNEPALIVENINLGNFIYVSPNSYITKEQKLIWKLDNISKFSNRTECIAEQYLGENRVVEILNFELFIKSIISDLKLISNKNILIDYDSYFFGVEKDKSVTELRYKIADFDNIFDERLHVYSENIDELFRALHLFVIYFVEEKSNKKYLEILENKKTFF